MAGKCCCGCCSLHAGTSIALAFTTIQSICGLLINVELLLLRSESGVLNPSLYVIDITKIDGFHGVFHGIVLAAIGLNAFWFVFGIIAITGNIVQSHGRLTPWVFITYLITIFQFGVTIYFAVKFQSAFTENPEFYRDHIPSKTLTYLTLLCTYSGGGLVIFLNFYFAHVVEMRGKEIDHDYADLMMYIFSHMNRCSQRSGEMQQSLLPEAPPGYSSDCPPYLPPEIYQRTNGGSSGSSWSVSVEAIKNTDNEQRNVTSLLATENLRCMLSRNACGYQPLNVGTNDTSVLPY